MSRIGGMQEVVPQCPWSFLARALGYRNQVRRYLLLVATLYPIAYMLFFMAVIGIAAAAGGGDPDGELPIPFGLLLALHLLTMLVTLALIVIYVIDVFRNPRVDPDHRILWLILILLGGLIAMPVYWLAPPAAGACPDALMWRRRVLLATLWPLVYVGLLFGDVVPAGLPSFFLHLSTIFWLMGLLAISIVDIFSNPRLTETPRIVWVIVLMLGNMLALPVYWLLYLRGWERPGAGAPAGLQNR